MITSTNWEHTVDLFIAQSGDKSLPLLDARLRALDTKGQTLPSWAPRSWGDWMQDLTVQLLKGSVGRAEGEASSSTSEGLGGRHLGPRDEGVSSGTWGEAEMWGTHCLPSSLESRVLGPAHTP